MKKIALAALLLSISLTAWAGGRNLKFYAKDISQDDMKKEMKHLKAQLGTTCVHCHQEKPEKDWAADTKTKKAALQMLEMTKRLNKEAFVDDYFPEKGAPKANCFICHKGKEKVSLVPENPDQEKKFNANVERGRHKEMVEAMKKLVDKLNKDFFTWEGAPKATCWMCHRGRGEFNTRGPKPKEDDDEEKAVDWGFTKSDDKKPDAAKPDAPKDAPKPDAPKDAPKPEDKKPF